jgi:sugar/nucleoside kinase (ribokinase family)
MSDPGSGRVLVVGDVMTDIICKPEGPLAVGSDRRATIRTRPGGSGANQAVWLAAFGLGVRFAARVGIADLDTLAARFSSLGIEPVLAGDPDLPSGTIVTILDPDGERSFLTDRGANAALGAADLPAALLDDCRTLLVSGYSLFEPGPRQAVTGLIAAAVARSVPVSVDPASVGFLEEVGPADFLSWTEGVTTIFANEAEALTLTGEASLDAQMAALGAVYRRVVIKRGAMGAAIGGRSGVSHSLPAPKVTAIDTTGAGDAFAAAFVAAELRGAEPADCLGRAIAAGAEAVTRFGGQPPRSCRGA